jgi:uncharacterized protein (TIGR01777 family)
MRIIVTGGTGFIGHALLPNLLGRNHGLVVASRDPEAARSRVPKGVATCPLSGDGLRQALRGSGAVIHLAGDPVVEGRWTQEKKRRIRSSRVDVTRALVEDLAAVPQAERPGILVSGSAVGWYGETGEDARAEGAPASRDFLGSVCEEWEAAARGAESLGLRVVLLRTGIVLGPGGGALEPIERAVRAFAGAPLGPGRNFVSWIHRDDLVAMIGFALEKSSVRGPLNGVAPEAARQREIVCGVARRLHRPCWPGIPRPLVRLIFGEKADAMLMSQRVEPRVARDQAFAWRFPTLAQALDDLYAR